MCPDCRKKGHICPVGEKGIVPLTITEKTRFVQFFLFVKKDKARNIISKKHT